MDDVVVVDAVSDLLSEPERVLDDDIVLVVVTDRVLESESDLDDDVVEDTLSDLDGVKESENVSLFEALGDTDDVRVSDAEIDCEELAVFVLSGVIVPDFDTDGVFGTEGVAVSVEEFVPEFEVELVLVVVGGGDIVSVNVF